jgi:CO/xanthine dehydrogenase FAD-binding subunit
MAVSCFFLARSLREALELLARWGEEAQVSAGGTDVMVALRNGNLEKNKTCLIDVSRVPELSFIRGDDAGRSVEIGSGVTHATISADRLVEESSLILGKASSSVGSPQVRNRGTIGGNILTAAQCADTIPALLALDADLVLMNTSGATRTLGMEDFFPEPKKTAIRADELLMAIRYPALVGSWSGSYYKLIRRAAVAKARLNFATLALLSASGAVEDVRISIGSTLPTPGRFAAAEKLLRGEKPSRGLISAAADACVEYMTEKAGRRWSSEYKEPVVRNIIARELAAVLGVENHNAQ